jgi:eukaryotic-like serine/threonine-protein kinase
MLECGSRLGPYEVLERLGAGGMGEVFRARDARLGRDVALKALFERFRLDPHRRARFEREARVLASLNHPNIATLYGIEDVGATQALVLELVDGQTLAERIADGPMPLSAVLAIAGQIAAALEAAHDCGVVHRDLKPANIKLREDGTVKLLDFGLAKIFDPTVAGSDPKAATVSAFDIGGDGAIMGTPAYMSPEQARGLPVEKRADIWAFGCVLYEMLTGHAAFAGAHASDVLARIIEREPDLGALPRDTPTAVRRVLRRCFEKEPRNRLRDIGDARLELAEAGARDADDVTAAPRRDFQWRRIAIAAAILAGVSAVIVSMAARFATRSGTAAVPAHPVSRFAIPARVIATASGRALALSADGAQLAYVTAQGLFVRSRDRLDGTLVHGLAGPGAGAPFFSPDGKWVAFTDGQALTKVPVAGGPAIVFAEVRPAAIGSWTAEGIVFADMRGLFRVPAEGGAPEALLTNLGPYEQAMFPQLLPERRAILFTIIPTRTNTPVSVANAPGARVEALDLATGERRTLIRGGGRAQYVSTGHLIYVAGETLYAVAFDIDRLAVRGDAVAVVAEPGISEFAVSDEGTLVYRSGTRSENNVLVWVDRQGGEESLETPPRTYSYPRLSPDGTRIALDVAGPPDRDIWMWDVRRKTLERFTLDPAGNPLMAWSLDGRRLAFGSDRFGVTNLFWQASDGSGEPERLLESERIQMPHSFAPDGRLLFSADVAGQGRDVHALATDGSARVERILYGPANEVSAEVSPDGRWIAYGSDESGLLEIYVRPYPDAYRGGRWQISSGGGRQPLWSRDGRELFYRDFSGAVLSAAVTLHPTFAPGPVAKLFDNASYLGSGSHASGRTYDLSLDGKRFLMIKQQEAPPSLVVVLNWFEELKRVTGSTLQPRVAQ